jgi:molecular chaperone DnaK
MKTIGIDLGTTNSIVAIRMKGFTQTLQIEAQSTLPSVVHFKNINGSEENVIVGKKAKTQLMIHPDQTVRSAKRFMGDINKKWNILGNDYSPIDISAFILEKIKDSSSEILNETVSKAVITVPAYFNNVQKSATQKAGEKAGLTVLSLLKEPTAAAIAYGLDKEKDQTIMVYDLGGGTFDVTILEVSGNTFIEKAIDGDSFLGGDDFDEIIKRYMVQEFENSFKSFSMNSADEKTLMEKAENIKIQLSTSKRVEETVILSGGKYTLDIDIKRRQFKELISSRIDDTIQIMYRALKKANLEKDEINRIILVGGSTNSPIISERLSEEIRTPYRSQNVDEIVAHGAAILADSMMPKPIEATDSRPIELKKITPFNMGVQVSDAYNKDKFSIIISDQHPIPCEMKRTYTTDYDNQNAVPIGVFQGFGQNCSDPDVQFVGGFILEGIPNAPKGVPSIDIKFSFNESDILEVTADCTDVGSKTIQLNINQTSDLKEIFSEITPSAVVLCIDISGSMSGSPIEQAIRAACAYIEQKTQSGSIVGCSVFASDAMQLCDLSDNQSHLKTDLQRLDTCMDGCGCGTDMEAGLKETIPMLTDITGDYNKQIIVLSDGYTSGDVPHLIPTLIENRITVHTVGAGDGYDKALLEELSTKTGGTFVPANDITTLIDAFLSLAEK